MNPVRLLDDEDRDLLRSNHDPKKTSFIKSWAYVRRVLDSFEDGPTKVMYAVGVHTGMRPGELRGLHWENVHLELERPFIYVCQQVYRSKLKNETKGRRSREVPVQAELRPILQAWKLQTGGQGLAFRPASKRGGRPGCLPSSSRSTRCGAISRLRLTLAGTRPSRGMRPRSTRSRATT